jgi:hypothetical protein
VKLPTEHQPGCCLQTARELAQVAGIPIKGAGTVLLALHKHGMAERRDGGGFTYIWRRARS